jgi:serine/threonine protein kinase
MGCTGSKISTPHNQSNMSVPEIPAEKRRESHAENIHPVLSDIKVHTVVSAELDCDHAASMKVPLGECSDEQLLAEVARRHLDLHDKITDTLVKKTYEVGRVLGHGASGQVYKVTHKENGKHFACKVVKKNKDMNDAQSMSTEIEIMKRIRHRHIVSMYELYEAPKCLWIILEMVEGGDIRQFLASATNYTEVTAARHFKQVLKGVHYLHMAGVVHRDLKLDNILLSSNTNGSDLKIADFGLSALVRINEDGYDAEESTKRKNYKQLTDMWGTREYFAPEVVQQAYGPQADVWALGCVLFEILSGEQAFGVHPHDTEAKFYDRILRADFNFNSKAWKNISDEAKDLIKNLLVKDPEKRLSSTEALLHPWITGEAHSDLHNQHLSESTNAFKIKQEERDRKEEARLAKK